MSQRPKTLKEILSEKRLCEWLSCDGLGYAEIAGHRYFLESDVVDFVWKKYLEDREPSVP